MNESETSARAQVRAAFRNALEGLGLGPEVIEEFLAKEAEAPYDGDRDAYLRAVRVVMLPLIEAKVAALRTESALRAEALRRFEEFRAMVTSGIVH